MTRKTEISHRTIIFTVFFLLFLLFLYQIRDIVFVFFVSLLIMAILNPTVSKLSKYRIPRSLSVAFVYLLVFAILGLVIAGIIPALLEQTTNFANSLPDYLGNIDLPGVLGSKLEGEIVSQISSIPAQLIKLSLSLFSNLLGLFAVFIFAFYLLIAQDRIDDQLGNLFGENKEKEVARILKILEEKLGGWARGELVLMFLVGISNFIGLTILGIPYALPLSILAGLLEIIPNFGPVLAAIPAAIIGFGISPVIGLATVALAFLIQQIENYIFVPKIMEKSVGVNPIVTLLSLAIGFNLAGIVGSLISIPVFITLRELMKYYLKSK